jgi:hypothetical protein
MVEATRQGGRMRGCTVEMTASASLRIFDERRLS